jgi:methionine-S-sulfoxide reductase
VRTRVGYSGGTKKDPWYQSLGDHTETVQIDYDPSQISYRELLDIFWNSHDPTRQAWSRQYMTAVFFHNEEQQRLAIETRNAIASRVKGPIVTQILSASEFYLAEEYHQKYRLRGVRDVMKEFSVMYPNSLDFVNSTAAARVNGYLAGYGSIASLETEVTRFGLSKEARNKLFDRVRALHR